MCDINKNYFGASEIQDYYVEIMDMIDDYENKTRLFEISMQDCYIVETSQMRVEEHAIHYAC